MTGAPAQAGQGFGPGSPTLRVTSAVLTTPALVGLMLAAVWGIAEGVLRQPAVQSWLPPPNLGSSNVELDLKVPLLRAYAAQGRIDCILVGNSSIEFSIRPEIFQRAYAAQTGESIRCFNFGVRATITSTHAALADWLVREFHPRLLIVGANVAAYANVSDSIGDLPWLRYQQGLWDPEGWLTEHSRLRQYWLQWSRLQLPDDSASQYNQLLNYYSQYPLDADGYFGRTDPYRTGSRPGVDLASPPGPNEKALAGLLYKFAFVPAQLTSLERLARLSSSTQILVVESPVHPTFSQFFAGGQTGYQALREQLANAIRAQGLRYWSTDLQPAIPDNGWHDRNHTNAIGAEAVSGWLGTAVGRAVQTGELADPAREGP